MFIQVKVPVGQLPVTYKYAIRDKRSNAMTMKVPLPLTFSLPIPLPLVLEHPYLLANPVIVETPSAPFLASNSAPPPILVPTSLETTCHFANPAMALHPADCSSSAARAEWLQRPRVKISPSCRPHPCLLLEKFRISRALSCLPGECNHPSDPHPAVLVRHDGYLQHAEKWKGAGVAVPVFSLRTRRSIGVGEFRDIRALVDVCRAAGEEKEELGTRRREKGRGKDLTRQKRR